MATERKHQMGDIIQQARALLASAANREPVDLAQIDRLVRACIELTDVGRLALAVLDQQRDSFHAPRRALELASYIVAVEAEPWREPAPLESSHVKLVERDGRLTTDDPENGYR